MTTMRIGTARRDARRVEHERGTSGAGARLLAAVATAYAGIGCGDDGGEPGDSDSGDGCAAVGESCLEKECCAGLGTKAHVVCTYPNGVKTCKADSCECIE